MKLTRRVVRTWVVCLAVVATVALSGGLLLSWRRSSISRRRLLYSLRTISLALSVYDGEYGQFPPTLGHLRRPGFHTDIPVPEGVVYTYWSKATYQYELPPWWRPMHEVRFYYPLDGDSAWICVGGALVKGKVRVPHEVRTRREAR